MSYLVSYSWSAVNFPATPHLGCLGESLCLKWSSEEILYFMYQTVWGSKNVKLVSCFFILLYLFKQIIIWYVLRGLKRAEKWYDNITPHFKSNIEWYFFGHVLYITVLMKVSFKKTYFKELVTWPNNVLLNYHNYYLVWALSHAVESCNAGTATDLMQSLFKLLMDA